jgi:restriction system protein
VGNKAVQEVFAAKRHEQAHHAAVVTNNDFTRSARQIAATTDVTLLHHDQLLNWAESIV